MIYFCNSFPRVGLQCYVPKEVGMPPVVAYAHVDCSEVESTHALERSLVEAMTAVLARRGFVTAFYTRKVRPPVTSNAAAEFAALVGTDKWWLADVALHAASGYMGTDVLLAAAPDG